MARQATWLSGLVPFAQAERILQEIGQIPISRCSIWRRSQTWGAQFGALEQTERAAANAVPEQWQPPSRAVVPDQRMGVAMDGLMVHVRGESWKELKAGAVFEIAVRFGKDTHMREPVKWPTPSATATWRILGDPRPLVKWCLPKRAAGAGSAPKTRRWSLTGLRGFGIKPIYILVPADNSWTGTMRPSTSPTRPGCSKGKAHPPFNGGSTAARRLSIRVTPPASPVNWSRPQLSPPKAADDLRREAGYFRTHQQRMNYLEMREEEYVIGSGMVEGGAKQYQARSVARAFAGVAAGPNIWYPSVPLS